MTREELYPEMRQFADEYVSLCRKYNCFVDSPGVLSVKEATDKAWASVDFANRIFERRLKEIELSLKSESE